MRSVATVLESAHEFLEGMDPRRTMNLASAIKKLKQARGAADKMARTTQPLHGVKKQLKQYVAAKAKVR